jgi:hypothetical protein
MFSRTVLRMALILLPVLVLLPGVAKATTFLPLLSSQTLAPDTQYGGILSVVHPAGSGNDTYNFTYTGSPILTATNTTTNFTLVGFGYNLLTVTWTKPDSTSTTWDATAGLTNQALSLLDSFSTPLPGLYQLILHWETKTGGSYTTGVRTPAVDRANELPLPPALLLFGSALVGLGALGRRKRRGAAV